MRWQKVISSLTTGSSATIVAALGTGVRWRLDYAMIGIQGTIVTTSVAFYEQGSATTKVFGFILATQGQPVEMNIAPAGRWVAATTNSRLAINNADGGVLFGIFIGQSF